MKFAFCLDKCTTVFEEDLSQLLQNLKHFVFLDIFGEINEQKLENYRLMVARRFPHAYFSIDVGRFRFWI